MIEVLIMPSTSSDQKTQGLTSRSGVIYSGERQYMTGESGNETSSTPSKDIASTPERVSPHSEMVAAQVRMLCGNDSLNPDKKDLSTLTKEQLGNLENHDYSLFNDASGRERKEFWKNSPAGENKRKVWLDETTKLFTDSQDFFETSEKGKAWKSAFARIDLDTSSFTAEKAEKLLDTYIDQTTGKSNIKKFVSDIVLSYQKEGVINSVDLIKDLPAFQWISRIYGENSSEVVTQLLQAEIKLIEDPQQLISDANNTTTDGQLRLNDLSHQERELLAFIWGNKVEIKSPESEVSLEATIAVIKKEPEQLSVQAINQILVDKGVDLHAVQAIDPVLLASVVDNLVIRQNTSPSTTSTIESFINSPQESTPSYKGTVDENKKISTSISESPSKNDVRRKKSGRGATPFFELGDIQRGRIKELVGDTPVVVIGGGPAGEMTIRAMIELGFSPEQITVIDRSGEYGGIWKQKNVNQGSRNNPVQFNFMGVNLDPAPGPGTSILDFMKQVDEGGLFDHPNPKPIKGIVTSVVPGDLHHRVTYKADGDLHTIESPIVINAIGTGKPLHPNRPGYMTTDTPSECGIRWQQIISPEQAEKYRDKRLIFIGLGNSTAEMVIQLQELNKKGYNIDYQIITHYPKDSVENPDKEFNKDGKTFRVFRDVSTSGLTKWEGDLPQAREAYEDALKNDHILPDVAHWHVETGKFTATNTSGEKFEFDFAQQFTLIGYRQEPELLKEMGLTVTDEYLGSIAYDYDGEIQREIGATGRDRVYPGYFGIGTILKSPDNPNALVMPGIMHQLYDQLFTATLRAAEYQQRKKSSH